MTHRRVVVQVAGAALPADPHRLRRQLRVRRRAVAMAERQHRAHDAVRAPLVVDEAARAELGERQEARPLQVGLASAAVVRRRDVGHERQAREVVARQEALGREVAVGVEVAREAARALLQQS